MRFWGWTAGLPPSAAPRCAIRGSVSDNTHERFAAAHGQDGPPEASSSGVISHVVLVCAQHLYLTITAAPTRWLCIRLGGLAQQGSRVSGLPRRLSHALPSAAALYISQLM